MSDYILGMDMSQFQGDKMNFTELAKMYKFMIHRAYVGNEHVDDNLVCNLKKAQDAGMAVGIYHFVFPLPDQAGRPARNPIEQANLHYYSVQDLGITLHCCDLEFPYAQDWRKWNCNAQQIKDWTRSYLIEYESLSGIKPMLYTYPSFAQSLAMEDDFTDYKLWIASYTKEAHVPKPWTDWTVWQNTGDTIKFNGITIDTNYCKDLSIFG